MEVRLKPFRDLFGTLSATSGTGASKRGGYSDVVQTAQSRFSILRKPFQLSALEKSIREALERGAAREEGERVLQFARWRGTAGRNE